MRIAHAWIACLVVAASTTPAAGQPMAGYAGYAPTAAAYPAGSAWGQAQPYAAQRYSMPIMQPGAYSGGAYMQPTGMQPSAAVPGGYDAASQLPYEPPVDSGMVVDGQYPAGDGMSVDPGFEQQMQFEPAEPPVQVPPQPVFGWNPPPTGSCILRAIGPPYAALRDSDGCSPGLLGDWAQVIRSRIGQFYIRAEAVMLRRTNFGGSNPLFVTNLGSIPPAPAQQTAIATNQLGFLNEVGQRMTLGVATSQRSAFEVTYLAVQNWQVTQSATGPANLFLGGTLAVVPPPAFSNDSFVSATAATMLTSLEFNYVTTTIFERFSIIGGFRYLDVKDALDLTGSSPSINGGPGNGTGYFAMNTLNQLYGGQIGLLFRQNIDLFTVELTSKAGAYGNYATQSQMLNSNGVIVRNGSGNGSISSFVGDINLSGIYHFSNFLALRFGYNVMWIDHVALAPGQLNLSANSSSGPITPQGNGINKESNLFLYGVNLGLDARF